MMIYTRLAFQCALAANLGYRVFACTTLVVGKDASSDGSVMVTHSNDFEVNPDARLCFVPAKDHAFGSTRPVYANKEDYKRFIGNWRGDCYLPQDGETETAPIGHIPEVNHTYAYYEAQYGIVNEHGLSMGETTCSSIYGAASVDQGGKALLNIDTLTRIAMERTRTAREAVQVIGSLAEKYGFFGADSFEGTAESLMIADPQEAFIFHITPDPEAKSAIWVAQRVPDDHVGVAPNIFVIRGINFNDPVNFLFSESVKTVALEQGLWRPSDGLLDFTKVYSDGEYEHKYYSGRRIWGAYRLFGIDLPDEYTNLRYDTVYPVTAKAPKKISPKDLFRIHRDYYQGTKYDLTQGLAAGPWGDPDRWETPANTSAKGNWERSIGIYRSSTTHVVQTRSAGQGAILWFAPHASASSVFIPVASIGSSVPRPYTVAPPNSQDVDSAYRTHRLVFNVAKMKYNHAMVDIRTAQSALEDEGFDLVRKLDALPARSPMVLNQEYAKHAQKVMDVFKVLPTTLLLRYADGNLNGAQNLGYPDWWLQAVGYQNGPPPPPKGPSVANFYLKDQVALVVICFGAALALSALSMSSRMRAPKQRKSDPECGFTADSLPDALLAA